MQPDGRQARNAWVVHKVWDPVEAAPTLWCAGSGVCLAQAVQLLVDAPLSLIRVVQLQGPAPSAVKLLAGGHQELGGCTYLAACLKQRRSCGQCRLLCSPEQQPQLAVQSLAFRSAAGLHSLLGNLPDLLACMHICFRRTPSAGPQWQVPCTGSGQQGNP